MATKKSKTTSLKSSSGTSLAPGVTKNANGTVTYSGSGGSYTLNTKTGVSTKTSSSTPSNAGGSSSNSFSNKGISSGSGSGSGSTYNIKSGDTLSGIAKSQGTTVADLMKNNPYITDPNKIYAGKNLNVIKNQSNLMQGTSASIKEDMATEKEVDALTNPPVNTPMKPDASGNLTGLDGFKYSTNAPSGFEYNLQPLDEGKSWVYNKKGKPSIMDVQGNITNDVTADKEYQKNLEINNDKIKYNNVLDSYKTNLDISHQNLIDGIKVSAQSQKVAIADLNKRMLGAKNVSVIRGGGAEYAPEIAYGILKAEEADGIARIAEIDAKMNLAIAEAVSAKTDKDFALAKTKIELSTSLRKEKETTIQNIYKNRMDFDKYLNDIKKEQRTQNMSDLKDSAIQLMNDYDALKTPASKEAYIASMAKKTGLAREIILSQIESARRDKQKFNKDMTPKATSTKTGSSTKILSASVIKTLKGLYPNLVDQINYGMTEADVIALTKEPLPANINDEADGEQLDENGNPINPTTTESSTSSTQTQKLNVGGLFHMMNFKKAGFSMENLREIDDYLKIGGTMEQFIKNNPDLNEYQKQLLLTYTKEI